MVKRRILLTAVLTVIIFLPFLLLKTKDKGFSLGFKSRYHVTEGYISEGDLLGDILLDQNIPAPQANRIIEELRKVFNVRKCRIGDRWEAYSTNKGDFIRFIYYDGPIDFYVVEYNRKEDSYLASAKQIEAERMLRGVRGAISSSLYESMSGAGVNPEIIVQFAEIFASKIDFFTDCRTGDRFTILWESYFDRRNNPLKDVRIVAASYSSSEDDAYNAFYFETADGKGGYYDRNGKSVEAAFLRAPLSYRRISSYFSYRRLHPIYKVYRPHLGIDYAAPSGTPVSTIGDGTVTLAGWNRGLGKNVVIRHPNGYSSSYGHLSRISRGVARGTKVRKGQVIGAVGATGTATGPHLDFRISRNGKFVNYLALKLPPSYPLPEKYMPDFRQVSGTLMSRMDSLKDGEVILFPNQDVKEKPGH